MDASFRSGLDTSAAPLRSENQYVLAALNAGVEQSGVEGRERTALRQAAKKVAVKAAIEEQVTSSESRSTLIKLIDEATTPGQIELMRQAWTIAVKTEKVDGKQARVADKAGVDSVFQVFEAFRNKSGSVAQVPEYLARISGEADTAFPAQVGTLTVADIDAKLEDVFLQTGARRRIVDADQIRNKTYQSIVERLRKHPQVKKVMGDFVEMLNKQEESYRLGQSASGGLVLDKNSLDIAVGQPYAKAAYELAQDVGKRLGFNKETVLVVSPSTDHNAFVYTSNNNMPRVTFYGPMLEKFWDNDANDWISINLGEDGKPAAEGTPGSKPVKVGELMVESVMAHELGHIRDQIVLHQSLIGYLFQQLNVDIFNAKLPKDMPEETKKEVMATMKRLKAEFNHACLAGGRLDGISFDAASSPKLFNAQEAEDILSDAFGYAAETNFLGCWSDFDRKMTQMIRTSEATADRYPIVLHGSAQWMGLMDAILALDLQSETSARTKKQSIIALMEMGPETYADKMLEQLAGRTNEELLTILNEQRSHPNGPTRIKHAYRYARDEDSFVHTFQAFSKMAPDERLLGVIQMYENDMARIDKALGGFGDVHESNTMFEQMVEEKRLQLDLTKREAGMKPFFDMVDRLIDGEGLAASSNTVFDRMLAIMARRGVDFGKRAVFTRTLRHIEARIQGELKGAFGDEQTVLQARLKEVQGLLTEGEKAPAKAETDGFESLDPAIVTAQQG